MTELTVIIPALNEEETLPPLLDDLGEQEGADLQVIVVDGGSNDSTAALARRRGVTVIETAAGRAMQMNRGARAADSDLLLFLHADSRIDEPYLLADAIDAFRARRARSPRPVAGHFSLTFDAHDGSEFRYRYLERKTELNRPNTTNGDQGFMVKCDFFQAVGGFDETLPFLEDQRFAAEVRRRGEWFTLPGRITTSSRRFQSEGFSRRYLLMAIIMGTFDAGVDEFFRGAPELYARHEETGDLELEPYFHHIWKVTRQMGLRRGLEAWFLVGRFIRQNAWQIPFAVDVAMEDELGGRTPLTDFFDEVVAEKIEGPGWDALTALLSAEAFMVLFPILYKLGD